MAAERVVRDGALIAEAAADASHLQRECFCFCDTRVRQGSVRCAIAESLHGIGPMRCSCPLPVPRGRWLDVPASSQEMAGKCSSASKSADVHLLTVGRTLAAGWHHRGDSTKKSLPY